MNTKRQIWMMVLISLIVSVVIFGATASITGNAIFDMKKQFVTNLGKTTTFTLEEQKYTITVTKIVGEVATFNLKEVNSGKMINYTLRELEKLDAWSRYSLSITDVSSKQVYFKIAEKDVNGINSGYTKSEVDQIKNELLGLIDELNLRLEKLEKLNNSSQPNSDLKSLKKFVFRNISYYGVDHQEDKFGAKIEYKNDTNRSSISIEYLGDKIQIYTGGATNKSRNFAYVEFTSARSGNAGEQTLVFAYDQDPQSRYLKPVLANRMLTDARKGEIITNWESNNASFDDWVVINQGDAGTIIAVDDISIDTATSAKVTLSDVITGESQSVTLTNSSGTYTKTGLNMFGGSGYAIKLVEYRGNAFIRISWDYASQQEKFAPRIRLKEGSWIAIGNLLDIDKGYGLTGANVNTPAIAFIEKGSNEYIIVPLESNAIGERLVISEILGTAVI